MKVLKTFDLNGRKLICRAKTKVFYFQYALSIYMLVEDQPTAGFV